MQKISWQLVTKRIGGGILERQQTSAQVTDIAIFGWKIKVLLTSIEEDGRDVLVCCKGGAVEVAKKIFCMVVEIKNIWD